MEIIYFQTDGIAFVLNTLFHIFYNKFLWFSLHVAYGVGDSGKMKRYMIILFEIHLHQRKYPLDEEH